jgi:hypothetical protein
LNDSNLHDPESTGRRARFVHAREVRNEVEASGRDFRYAARGFTRRIPNFPADFLGRSALDSLLPDLSPLDFAA